MNIQSFVEGDELYAAMLSAISSAEKEIFLESYIFSTDSVGEKFIDLLNIKAQQNVSIKVHLDAVGSRYFRHRQHFVKRMDTNIDLKWFHRWSWRRPSQFNVRNHRKLLIVDGIQVFIGGFNIHQQSSLEHFGDMRWRDSHLKIEGELAKLCRRYFVEFWRKRRQHYLGPFENVDLVPNLTFRCRYLFRCKLKKIIRKANSSLYCTTPYFIPDEYVIKALIDAAKRGVDVRLLVPYESDHQLVNSLANRFYFRLIQFGIKVYAYMPRMIHAKTIVVDSKLVMIGSANLDYRSLFINHELVCFIRSESLSKKMNNDFLYDCQQATLVNPKTRFNVKLWLLWHPLATILKHWI